LLPDHLKPWADILNHSWPDGAGPIPDEKTTDQAQELGARLGKKYGLAWVMFCRPDGASRKEIWAACGASQFQAAKQAQLAGKLEFMVGEKGQGKRYYMGPPGSHPGGPDVVSVSNTKPDDDPVLMLEESSFPQNLILYGPPGTGKTFASVELVLEILDPAYLDLHRADRTALKKRFDTLIEAGDVRFVTFHQSFSYEDFVEGLRADRDDDGRLQYIVEDGVFKRLCDSAAARITRQIDASIDLSGRRIWKMSLGNTLGDDAYIYDECIENGYALLGYGDTLISQLAKVRMKCLSDFSQLERMLTKTPTQ
jgi:hypothetical protein